MTTTTTKGTMVAKAHAPKASKVNLAAALDSVYTDTAVAEEDEGKGKRERMVKGKEAEKFNTSFQYLLLESIEVEKGFNARVDYGDMETLQESISQAGLITPLTVRSGKNGKWLVVDGHRRLKALQALTASGDWKFDGIGCFIEDNTITEAERTLELLVTNDGKPLTMVEQADVFDRLEKFGMSPAKISAQAGKTTQHIRDCKLLATATSRTMQMLADGKIAATNIISIIRKEGDPKKAEVKVMELVAGTSATGKGKVSGKAVKAATGKDKKTAEGSSLRDRLNSIYERIAVNEKELKYSEYDLITVMQWMETGQGDIEAILKGKNQKGAK